MSIDMSVLGTFCPPSGGGLNDKGVEKRLLSRDDGEASEGARVWGFPGRCGFGEAPKPGGLKEKLPPPGGPSCAAMSGRSMSSDSRLLWTGPKQMSSEEWESLSPDSGSSLLSWRERSSNQLLQSEEGGGSRLAAPLVASTGL